MVIWPGCVPLYPRAGCRYVYHLQNYLQSSFNEHNIVYSTSSISAVYYAAQ